MVFAAVIDVAGVMDAGAAEPDAEASVEVELPFEVIPGAVLLVAVVLASVEGVVGVEVGVLAAEASLAAAMASSAGAGLRRPWRIGTAVVGSVCSVEVVSSGLL